MADRPPADAPATAGAIAELYLGNILYAIELAALSLQEQDRRDDAAFYRGIGRKLAEAYGRQREEAEAEGRGRKPDGT